jgi:predicted lipoprotein with Yx(FWY)xxD motif
MRKAIGLAAPLTIASLLLAACGSSSSSNPYSAATAQPSAQTSASTAVAVKSASSASLGTVLVDAQGMMLYHLTGEGNGKFICTSSACLSVWHPVAVPAGGTAGSVGSLTVIKRPDGTSQVAYNGEPLYTFASDTSPGEAKGQGLKDVGTWTTVTITPAAQPSTTTTTTSSGYGHSYP